MKKAQIGTAVIIATIVALIVGAIGVQIVNDVVFPACHGTGRACYANHNFTNAAYTALPDGSIEANSERVYNASTCTGALVGTGNYTMNNSAGGILMANNLYNNTNQSIRYSAYLTSAYLGGGIKCSIVDNFAILFAVGVFVVAGAWFFLKG